MIPPTSLSYIFLQFLALRGPHLALREEAVARLLLAAATLPALVGIRPMDPIAEVRPDRSVF